MNDEQTHAGEQNKNAPTDDNAQLRAQVVQLCNDIPVGRVTSYGALGKKCDPPISGYVCGRIMGNIMEGSPWWRVVGKEGNLPISKRGPLQSIKQRELLEAEGIEFDEETRVLKRFFVEEQAETDAQMALFGEN